MIADMSRIFTLYLYFQRFSVVLCKCDYFEKRSVENIIRMNNSLRILTNVDYFSNRLIYGPFLIGLNICTGCTGLQQGTAMLKVVCHPKNLFLLLSIFALQGV